MNDSFESRKENKTIKNIKIAKPNFWTKEEDKILKEKSEEYNYKDWKSIANFIPGRTSIQCSGRYRRIRPGLVKGYWDKEEDNKLLFLFEKYGKNWAAISKEMPHRTGKQIRDRFLNSLDSKFERGKFTEEEDQTIIKYYKIYGNSWTKIAKKLNKRTGDMVKNRFYSSLKKTIFNNQNLLKRKRNTSQKNKDKNEKENNNIETNKKMNLIEKIDNFILEIESVKNKEPNKISTELESIKKSQENEEINYQNIKIINISNRTNNNSYDSNNYSIDKEKSIDILIQNNSFNFSIDLDQNLKQKQLLDENDNNFDFNLEENKRLEMQKFPEFNNYNYINSESFSGLNENVNNISNFIDINQNDDIDEKLEKLQNFQRIELEYKQNLKEKLDIIL